LTEDGFLDHQRSRTDRRSVRISLTEKGRDARDIVAQVFARHLVSIADEGRMGSDDFTVLNKALLRLERFWTDQIMYRL
jgi:DNA-binding MarR family transcriptional regulator